MAIVLRGPLWLTQMVERVVEREHKWVDRVQGEICFALGVPALSVRTVAMMVSLFNKVLVPTTIAVVASLPFYGGGT
jgi:hypothetical protein